MEVAPGIHHFETFPFNWYVIEEAGRLTLLDAGFPGHYKALVEGLRSIGRELQDIEAVVLTHIHADHIGFAQKLRRELKVPVYVHRDDIPASREITRIPPSGFLVNLWRPFVQKGILLNAVRNGVFTRSESIVGATPYKADEVLNVPGRPRVIHVPGHTAGECMLHLEDRSVLFSGDAIVTLNLLTGENVAPRVPYRRVNDNDRLARYSVAMLEELGRFKMLPGHGRPWTGTVEEVAEAAQVANLRSHAAKPLWFSSSTHQPRLLSAINLVLVASCTAGTGAAIPYGFRTVFLRRSDGF